MTGYREENKLIMDKNAPIGVFDSGVGGLTVAREIMRQIPNERIVYFGDTARVPYGSKSKDNIIKFSRQIIRFLQTENVKAIVIACNTASALALDEMQQIFEFNSSFICRIYKIHFIAHNLPYCRTYKRIMRTSHNKRIYIFFF